MPPTVQIFDALWHCLCPRFQTKTLAIAHTARPIVRKSLSRRDPAASRAIHQSSTKCYRTPSARNIEPIEVQANNWRHHLTERKDDDVSGNGVRKAPPLAEVYGELRWAANKGEFIKVQELVRTLVIERRERPNVRLYAGLILANICPEYGSLGRVERLLQEMVEEGIQPDSSVCHAVLKVLAIHPDYILRPEILEELRQRWFTLTDEGWHDVVAGLIRDRQIELALNKLSEMQDSGIKIQTWLYDLFLYALCSTGDFDEVLKIMTHRDQAHSSSISNTLWYHILDTSSQSLHHATTHYAWRKRVERGYLNPSSGICINVLNTAARHGDFRLATDVFRILGNRTNTLQAHHYEALFESYLRASAIKHALSVLTLMASSGCPPTEATTRPLYQHLRSAQHLPNLALTFLRALHREGNAIPTVAFNALIEAATYTNNLTDAFFFYKKLHTFCPAGPTTATFNALFRGCSKAGRKDVAMFLASEMLALKVQPDTLTYDRLILTCVEGKGKDDFEDSWRYWAEMRARGWWPRRGTCIAVVKRCCERGDERVWGLVEEMEERGMEVQGVLRWVGLNWKENSRIEKEDLRESTR